jgi:hypothetical protein
VLSFSLRSPLTELSMSLIGTFRTCRDVRLESVMRSKADICESNLAPLKEVTSIAGRPMSSDLVSGRW